MKSVSQTRNQFPSIASGMSDEAWIKAHSAVLTKKYAREWIAVYRHSVVAHGRNPDVVHQSARTIVGDVPITMKHVEKGIVIL